jgi:hypothetical protein
MKTYRPKKIALLPVLIVPAMLTIGLLLLHGSVDQDRMIGVLLFTLAALVPVCLVAGNKVVVNDESGTVLAYMFKIKTLEITRSSVREMYEGYLFPILPAGGGVGKGLIIRANYNGRLRIFRMGIALYGERAVGHVKKILKG